MVDLQKCAYAISTSPAAILDDAAATANVLDWNDFADADYVEFIPFFGATDIASAVFRVMESDTKTDGTTLGGTPVLVQTITAHAAGDDDTLDIIGIHRTGRERYLQLQFTAGDGTAGTYFACLAVFSRRKYDVSTSETSRGERNSHYVTS
jgi:hypothetical protein